MLPPGGPPWSRLTPPHQSSLCLGLCSIDSGLETWLVSCFYCNCWRPWESHLIFHPDSQELACHFFLVMRVKDLPVQGLSS